MSLAPSFSTFSRPGCALSYSVVGEGPPIVLIHGFASTARVNWHGTGWVEFLSQNGFKVITFDNRGHGQSSLFYTSDDYRLSLFTDDTLALLDHLQISSCALMGYSMGARIAATVAIAAPSRVTALMLGGLASAMFLGLEEAQTVAIIDALNAERLEDVRDTVARAFRKFADQTGSDRRALAACLRNSRQPLTASDLATVRCPTLVVCGSEDALAGPVDPLVEVLPHGKGVILDGLDHMKIVGHPSYKEAVLSFLTNG